jgi:hypothetical protein
MSHQFFQPSRLHPNDHHKHPQSSISLSLRHSLLIRSCFIDFSFMASRAADVDFVLPSGTPFGTVFWGDNCEALDSTFASDCGFILSATTARVNVPVNTGDRTVSGVTLWTNSPGAGRDKDYLLSFKMTIVNDELSLTVFYSINGGPRQLEFTSGFENSPSNLILYANQSFTLASKPTTNYLMIPKPIFY